MMSKDNSIVLNDAEAKQFAKLQRQQLKRIRKLLVQLRVDNAMIDAINQAIYENDRW
jgi:hypothetical protein